VGGFGGERIGRSTTCSGRQSFGASRSAHTTGYEFRLWWRWETRAGFQGSLVVCLRPEVRIRKVVFDYRWGLGHVRFRSFSPRSPNCRRRCAGNRTGGGWSRWPRDTTTLTRLAFHPLLNETDLLFAITQFCAGLCEWTMIRNRVASLITVRDVWSVSIVVMQNSTYCERSTSPEMPGESRTLGTGARNSRVGNLPSC
jgi:hypothetical protein